MQRLRSNTARLAAIIALTGMLVFANPVSAASSSDALFARTSYIKRFKDYWGGVFKQQNGIVLIVMGVGAVSMFIITRGKWRK